ncbi:SAM-dependent methyltransferase [Saccharopolyspora sp. TS4A08]|uniref:SAM-dependent methyltransferase n=1 Tax=Saccharopolyspora ipomoeae TaxID=3042027 RepID=A0ABT6PTU6_9PSEU|nr:SAM-dependent methyltransferase [Saccharopolyspora sp. TS4A08]MDI2031429.1 SAM-dependent methyltransferase [Saccharopolyspora sp. TS4A08]
MSETPSKAPSSAPVGVDTATASIARVYDAALNGKDNFEVDRQVLHEVAQAAPEVKTMAWSNRGFLNRACQYLADEAGVRQFLDCGSGLPTAENTHQIVQRVDPEAEVVYIDNDPVVIAHGKALLEENDHTHFASADIFDPGEVLGHETVRRHLDFDEPIALLQIGTLHHYLGDDGPELMRTYIDALAPGSYVVLAHFFDPETPEHSDLARRMEELFLHSPMGSGLFRTRDQIRALLPGLDILPPGPDSPADIELCDLWWPNGPRQRPLNQAESCIAGVVGRKNQR